MSLNRREFMQVLGIAAASGMVPDAPDVLAAPSPEKLYDVPRYGNVHLMHFTDCHVQLLPVYFREPSVNIGVGDAFGRIPHLVGEHLLKQSGMRPGSPGASASRKKTCKKWSTRPVARARKSSSCCRTAAWMST